MAARFEIEVLTRFRTAGLSEIANEARRALAQVANQPGLSSATRVTQASQIRTEAQRAIGTQTAAQLESVRASGLTGNALAAAENAVKTQGQRAQRAVNVLFKEIEGATTDLGKRIAKAVKASGTKVATQAEATSLAGTTSRPLTGAETREQNRLASQAERLEAETRLANNPAYYDNQRQLAAVAARRANIAAQLAAQDEVEMGIQAETLRLDKERNDRIRAAMLGVRNFGTAPINDVRAASAVAAKVEADLAAARVARARTVQERTQGSAEAAASRARREAERELTRALHDNARQEVRSAISHGEGTRFQRLQARFQAGGSNRLPDEFQRLGQFVGSRSLTTVGYGIAGTALYGGARAIKDMLHEAAELDKQLNQIEAQLRATDSAGKFPEARQGILDIARNTGAAADEVAAVQFQFQGAFGRMADGTIDVNAALVQTEAAMKVVATTGLSLQEVLDSLTATARTFGVGIEDIGDIALGVQERFGVLARETITFTADLAPVAQQIGLSLEDLASLGGVAQQVSGKSGASLAEGFGRVFPQLQELRDQIVEIYNLPQLQGKRQGILEAFAGGQTGQVFKSLVTDFQSLSEAQQNFVIDMLGGRREAQVLIPVLQNASLLTADWDRNLSGLNNTSGKTDDYFASLQTTVGQAQARFTEAVRQIGEGLFRSGAADAFVAITNAAAGLMDIISSLINVFGGFNNQLGGLPARILLFAAAFKILQAVVLPTIRLIRAKSTENLREYQTSSRAAAGNLEQAASEDQVAVSATAAATATRAAAAADIASATSSEAAAAGNAIQGVGGLARPGEQALFGAFGGAGAAAPVGALAKLGGKVKALGAFALEAAPIILAMEALNQFYSNSAEQAQEAADLAQEIADKFSETTDSAATIAELRGRADAARAETGKTSVGGNNPFAKVVNFVTGRTVRAFGGDGDALLRAASGQPQDYEVIEQELAKREAEGYTATLSTILAHNHDQFLDALKNANLSALNAAVLANPDYAGGVTDIFAGGSGLDGQLGALLAANGTLITKETLTDENIRKLVDLANTGDQLAVDLVGRLAAYINENPALRGLLDAATNTELEDAARSAAGGEGNYQLQSIDQAKQRFEAGNITLGAYLREVRERRRTILDAIEATRGQGDEPLTDDLIALSTTDQQISQAILDYQKSRAAAFDTYADLIGAGSPGQQAATGAVPGAGPGDGRIAQFGDVQGALLGQKIEALTSVIRDPEIIDTQKFDLIPDLITALQAKFARDLDNIVDPVERARVAAQGFQIPPELQELFVQSQLVGNEDLSNFVQEYADITGTSVEAFMSALANGIVTTADDVRTITLEIMDAQIAHIRDLLSQMSPNAVEHATRLLGSLADLEQLRADTAANTNLNDQPVELGGLGYADDQTQQQAADQARRAARARAEAQLNIQRAQAQGDPVRLAQLDIQAANLARQYAEDDAERFNAEADRIRAVQALQDAQADITRARLELYANEVQRDPVRAAQAQLALAQNAIAQANSTAEAVRAQIAVNDANRALVDAQNDITLAWLESVESYFNIIGDSVGAANAALEIARTKLAEAISGGAGQAERTRAETAVREAEAAVRDAGYNDQLGDIDYLLEMEKISTQQAIEMLQQMMRIPGLTEEQLRNLERRINSLRDELSQDFQFNLPGEIELPTLYEVRRLNQTPGGASYQDNRTIQVNFTANNVADAQAIASTIVDQFSRPSRFGSSARRY